MMGSNSSSLRSRPHVQLRQPHGDHLVLKGLSITKGPGGGSPASLGFFKHDNTSNGKAAAAPGAPPPSLLHR